jgi:hypothetical protein
MYIFKHTRNISILLIIMGFILLLSGCSAEKKNVENVTIIDNNYSGNDSSSCLAGLDEILCQLRNETKVLNISKAVSVVVCSKNITSSLSNYSESELNENTLNDIMHVWLFYLSKQRDIKDIDLISRFAAENIYKKTSLGKDEVERIIFGFLSENHDDPSYPNEFGILRGRSKETVLKNNPRTIDEIYLENLLAFDDAAEEEDCVKIVVNNYRDELLLDACKLLFVKDLKVYCSTII